MQQQQQTVYIGLGSNLQQPLQQLSTALKALDDLPNSSLLACSSFYQSKPLGPDDQGDFINAVAKLETSLEPLALLDALQTIEQSHQRVRERHWGPRTLDLDILLIGQQKIDHKRLQVPHAQMHLRSFVLEPLLEIQPDITIPGFSDPVDLLNASEDLHLQRIACS